MSKGDQKSNREKRKPKAENKATGKKTPSYLAGSGSTGLGKPAASPLAGPKGRK